MLTRYQGLGQFNTAIEYHRRHLEIAQEKGDNENIGNFYLSLGQFKRAIEFHVNQKVPKWETRPQSYGNLSKDYCSLLNLTAFSHKEQKNEIVTRSVLNNVFILHHFPVSVSVSVSHKQKQIGYISVPCDFNYLQWNSCTFHWTKACRIAIKFLAAGQERESARQTH